MKIIAITQARMTSSRLAGKVLKVIEGNTLLDIHVKRVSKSKYISKHIIAIPNNSSNDLLKKYCDEKKYNYYRGSESDVLDRFYQIVKLESPDIVIRLTADCPLIDSEIIDKCINDFIKFKPDYLSNTLAPTYPDGLDVEIFTPDALKYAWENAQLKSDREHVTPFIYNNSDYNGKLKFKALNYQNNEDYSMYRITVDELNDFSLIEILIKELGVDKGWKEYLNCIIKNKYFDNLNNQRNEGYEKSLKND